MKRHLSVIILASLVLASCAPKGTAPDTSSGSTMSGTPISLPDVPAKIPTEKAFGEGVAYAPSSVKFSADITKDFSTADIKNMENMAKAYGITLTGAQKDFLSKNKFLLLPLLSTSIRPKDVNSDNYRELLALFNVVVGNRDVKERKPENAVFYSADLATHSYSLLFVELLKEMENTVFFPAMQKLSLDFFNDAKEKIAKAKDPAEKAKWTKVRNYFAVGAAIFSKGMAPPNKPEDFLKDGQLLDPATVQAEFKKNDTSVDTEKSVAAVVKGWKLDPESEKAILADIHKIYDAGDKGVPDVFKPEYDAYTEANKVKFSVDFTQFTPRSHYTSSSLRRQYFRGMNWYIQVPFFLKSPQLTTYAYAISQLMAENPDDAAQYGRLEQTINFLVGTSDDLMPVDYLQSLVAAKGKTDPEAVAMDYLVKARPPKIKSLAADYPTVGDLKTDDVILLTKGMRFFSGKFIVDSSWTQRLTQGDEAPRPGYPAKLPPMASSLEVMGLLGSDYAKSKIPTLDFYKGDVGKAIDKAMADIAAEEKTLTDKDWQASVYSSALWAIKGMFSFLQENTTKLPMFMQSPNWGAKTLMSASGFWTELRHAVLLYAKQSFAEKGGGGGDCDTRKIPAPVNGYVEPSITLYDRLLYVAERTKSGLEAQKYQLTNLFRLQSYIDAVTKMREYALRELRNAPLAEKVKTDVISPTCTQYSIDGTSDVEDLRLLLALFEIALPTPIEGPVLPVKDRRMALVADVHTGGDSNHDPQILYEGIGVPSVLLTAVKDVNGARLTIGFTYTHYEVRKDYGGKRMTDEDWQTQFYKPSDDPFAAYDYTDGSSWPKTPSWYDAILHVQ
jgi:hypothetical protein